MHHVEIERKFLIADFPQDLPLLEEATVWQGYLCVDPVVRIRKKEIAGNCSYRLCFKGEGTLVRPEVELDIDADTFEALSALLHASLIRKDYRMYQLPDGNRLECSLVDRDMPTAFYYAEVEFDTVEQANVFTVFEFLGEEKTQDPNFTMSAYWLRRYKK